MAFLASRTIAGIEGRHESLARSLGRTCAGLILVLLLHASLLAVLPVSPTAAEPAWFWFAASAGLVCLTHGLWHVRLAHMRRTGKLMPNIVIVGATLNAARLIERAAETGEVAVLGVFDDRVGRVPTDIGGVAVLGDTEALLAHRILPYVDRIVVAVPSRAQERVRELLKRLQYLPNEVSLFLDVDGEVEPSAVIARLGQMPLARLSGHRVDEPRMFAKRVQDLVLGCFAVMLALPVMLALALAIRLDSPGPVLFRQRRHGFNNEPIVVWKFRSMRHDMEDARAVRQVAANDVRVTRVGRFMRRTSLDELPQFFNVLRGEISLVGPRPHAIGMKTGNTESARLVAEYAHRHRIKPGITSWAAIHGSRGPVHSTDDVRRRVALDIEYIERQSFWLDIYIMLKTLPCMLGDRHAVR
jgi:Undecaprenyl-phosphate glucose phosphotransferase